MISVRLANAADNEKIKDVHMRAFPTEENSDVANLAANLLVEETHPETFAFIAELGNEVAGHIAFSPVAIEGNNNWLGYILTPLGVAPEHQKSGIGRRLIESGIEKLTKEGVDTLLVYGDPAYYRQFGFSVEEASTLSFVESLNNPDLW